MDLFCGIDWAEGHHDVALVDSDGIRVAKVRIDTGAKGFSDLESLLAEHSTEPSSVPVAIETDKNLIVVALLAAGHTVYAINPRAVARYRERHHQAGGKSDPGDAAVLANILRTDRHEHRVMPQISEDALAVRALARQHQEAIWARQLTVNRLRSVFLEFYPNALAAFPILTHKAALEVLGAAPTPGMALKLTRKRVVTLLQRSGRGDRPGLADTIMVKLGQPALRQPRAVEDALGRAVTGLVSVIKSMEASRQDVLWLGLRRLRDRRLQPLRRRLADVHLTAQRPSHRRLGDGYLRAVGPGSRRLDPSQRPRSSRWIQPEVATPRFGRCLWDENQAGRLELLDAQRCATGTERKTFDSIGGTSLHQGGLASLGAKTGSSFGQPSCAG